MVGDARLATMLHPGETKPPEEVPNANFEAFLNEIEGLYRGLLTRLQIERLGLKIVVHGYDHPIPNDGKWVGRPMKSIQIEDHQLQTEIVKVMIARYNDRLVSSRRARQRVPGCLARRLQGRGGADALARRAASDERRLCSGRGSVRRVDLKRSVLRGEVGIRSLGGAWRVVRDSGRRDSAVARDRRRRSNSRAPGRSPGPRLVLRSDVVRKSLL